MRRWIGLAIVGVSFSTASAGLNGRFVPELGLRLVQTGDARSGPVRWQDNPLAPNAPKAHATPFAGVFLNDTIRLELRFDAKQAAYVGWLTIGGNRFAIGGFDDQGKLAGKFTVGQSQYDFQATLAGDVLTLTSDGQTHTLKREGAAPANPRDPNAPAAPAAKMGGVGVAFEPSPDGKLMLRAIMPGSPADKAKLKAEGWLVAVDGKPVDGLDADALRARIGGPIGSMVTLTIETESEVMDVILPRADLSGGNAPAPTQPEPNQPTPNQPDAPVRPVGPAAGGQPGHLDPTRQHAPLGLRAGMRVTYYVGSASIAGVRTSLVQDDNGNWVDSATGQRYAEAENPNSAGAGYVQWNVIAADQQDIAVDARNYTLIDPQQGRTMSSGATAYVGTPDGLGEFWQPPAKLAAMVDGDSGGTRIRRMNYPINGKTFQAITITTTSGANFMRSVYDLQSGLLIATSSSSVGSGTLTPNPNGTSSPAAGATMITSTRLVEIRDLQLPWANAPMPKWLADARELQYSGSYANVMQGAPVMPWKMDVSFSVHQAKPTWIALKQRSWLHSGMGGPPQEAAADRAVSSNMVDPVWIDPALLAKLAPNTVIDEDRITQRRITYAGPQGNLAFLVEQSPLESNRYGYDLKTGLLVSIENSMQQGPATIQTQLQITKQP